MEILLPRMKYTHEIVGTHEGALLPESAPGACSGSKIPRVYRPLDCLSDRTLYRKMHQYHEIKKLSHILRRRRKQRFCYVFYFIIIIVLNMDHSRTYHSRRRPPKRRKRQDLGI